MTKPKALLLDARMLSGEIVAGWSAIEVYGHDQLTHKPTKEIIKQHALAHTQRLPFIIDLEDPPTPSGQDFYIDIADAVHEFRPDLRVGFYAMIPTGNWWAPIIAKNWNDKSQMRQWSQLNDQMTRGRNSAGKFTHRGLADVVDFVCPSLYMAYRHIDTAGNDHTQLWFDAIAPAQIEQARKYGKQVYPFVCPRVAFDNSVGDANKYVGDDVFRRQIQFCLDNADGCIVWDYYKNPDAETVLKQTSQIMREFK